MRDILFEKTYKLSRIFVMNIVAGIGWAFGLSIGFTLLISLLTWTFSLLGGLPLIGNWFADLILNIQQALDQKTFNL